MDRAEAMDHLPTAYANALRLKEAGASEALIAKFLDIAIDAVGPLITLGEAKLAKVQGTPVT